MPLANLKTKKRSTPIRMRQPRITPHSLAAASPVATAPASRWAGTFVNKYKKQGLPIVCYCVKTDEELAKAKKVADNFVFENIKPE